MFCFVFSNVSWGQEQQLKACIFCNEDIVCILVMLLNIDDSLAELEKLNKYIQ